jgi:hypothetical protein
MECKFIKVKGTWRDVVESAMTTIGLEAGDKEPTSTWKRRILMAEHSPIRQIIIKAKWYDLAYWVSVHLVRHWLGIIHWVKSQRPDRISGKKSDRNKDPQDTPINHAIEANAQAIINISRKRLCMGAMPETREAWKSFLDSFADIEPELYRVCVRECIYRGFCPEYYSCKYHETSSFACELEHYRDGINTPSNN